MRSLFYLSCLILFSIFSCRKGSPIVEADSGCISLGRFSYNVSKADSAAAVALFKKNNISVGNLVFRRVILNDTSTALNTNPITVYQHVQVQQYFNGLPILNSALGYHFKNDVFQFTMGTKYTGVNLGTSQHLRLSQVRALYVKAAEKDISAKDSCLVTRFGYYDVGHDNNAPPSFVKAWWVTPAHAEYPLGIFRDDNGASITYFNGIVTLF